jgi:transcriptional regulator CtsR
VAGHIRIKKINITKSSYLMHIITSLPEEITAGEVDIYLSNFLSYSIITEKEAKLLKVATSDNVLSAAYNTRDKLRANIFKNMLLNLIED